MDHNVPRAITDGLRARGVDVITAFEDGYAKIDDVILLDRAGKLGRVLFTRDYYFLLEATRRQRNGIFFNGIIYAHQLEVSIGKCIRDLYLISEIGEPEDFKSRVEYLPL